MKKCPQCGREYQDTNSICTADGTALEKSGDALVGQTLADKYRVEEHLSDGGMGAVYRGTHVLMDKTVAIKVLHPSLAADDKIVQRFSREARAASRISHPHALNVTDFGESENGVVFLVMEYLRGRTLKEVIHQDGQMPLARVVEIMRQVTGALAAAHAEGVVHRDLKSDNIMLVDADNGQDWAKVLDFGIAKIQEPVGQDPALTAPNLIIGTPQYMSPEQCSQASELDARSDIYSLGVILYEMLVGHVPFSGDSPTAVMMRHLQEPPPSLLEDRSDLPPAVSRVVTRAMAKRPEDRYQTVGELADALALAAEGQPLPDAAAGVATAGVAPERATARIVVPTASNNAPRPTTDIEEDDSTIVVPPQPGRSAVVETETVNPQYAVPPPPDNFNLVRILGLSAVALLVVFAIVYAITSRKPAAPAANNQNPAPLTSDPNGQAVTPAQAPTGQSETGITAAVPTPSNTNVNTSAVNANPSAIGNANREAGTTLPGLVNANTNTSGNRRNTSAGNASEQNNNAANTNAVEVVSPESNKNSERRPSPTPQTSPATNANSDDEPPPPPPAQKKIQPPALPKPTLPATDNTTPPPGETPAG
jgi:serine/threonine protein kinase